MSPNLLILIFKFFDVFICVYIKNLLIYYFFKLIIINQKILCFGFSLECSYKFLRIFYPNSKTLYLNSFKSVYIVISVRLKVYLLETQHLKSVLLHLKSFFELNNLLQIHQKRNRQRKENSQLMVV